MSRIHILELECIIHVQICQYVCTFNLLDATLPSLLYIPFCRQPAAANSYDTCQSKPTLNSTFPFLACLESWPFQLTHLDSIPGNLIAEKRLVDVLKAQSYSVNSIGLMEGKSPDSLCPPSHTLMPAFPYLNARYSYIIQNTMIHNTTWQLPHAFTALVFFAGALMFLR